MTGEGNWTWLIQGRVPTLIDAGAGDPRHVAAVAAALGDARLAQVLVTHSHGDHAAGAAALAARMPDARFAKMPWPERDARWGVTFQPIVDDERIHAGDTEIVAVHTPGHAPDHLCFWHAPTRSVFCGDLAVQGTTVMIPGGDDGDVAAYIRSIERILALEPERMYPAHGAIIEEPAKLLRMYIRHRQEREAQVLAALRAGDTTAAAMTERIYRGLDPALLPAARASVTAHLRKLEREGRARRAGDAWHMT